MAHGTPRVSESDYRSPAPLEAQKDFWNRWNQTWRFGDGDGFMDRQREATMEVAKKIGLSDARILDVGCGTGWLGNALSPFGQVWATDLSPEAVAEGQRRHPGVHFVCGDFLEVPLEGPFDFVVAADSIANMQDQEGCVRRVADLLRKGGTYLLMTPNRRVWERRSAMKPLGKGQVQTWPGKGRLETLLCPFFAIEQVQTIDPGGDRGALWWVENRVVRGAMGRLLGRKRWRSLLEAARLGRELVVVARRI